MSDENQLSKEEEELQFRLNAVFDLRSEIDQRLEDFERIGQDEEANKERARMAGVDYVIGLLLGHSASIQEGVRAARLIGCTDKENVLVDELMIDHGKVKPIPTGGVKH